MFTHRENGIGIAWGVVKRDKVLDSTHLFADRNLPDLVTIQVKGQDFAGLGAQQDNRLTRADLIVYQERGDLVGYGRLPEAFAS